MSNDRKRNHRLIKQKLRHMANIIFRQFSCVKSTRGVFFFNKTTQTPDEMKKNRNGHGIFFSIRFTRKQKRVPRLIIFLSSFTRFLSFHTRWLRFFISLFFFTFFFVPSWNRQRSFFFILDIKVFISSSNLLFSLFLSRSQIVRPLNAFLVVDVQNDFISGSLNISNCSAQQNGIEVSVQAENQLFFFLFSTVMDRLDVYSSVVCSFNFSF